MASVEDLAKKGISAYWTGCISMYAGRRLMSWPLERRERVLIIDIDAETERCFVPAEIARSAERLTTAVDRSIPTTPLSRLAAAARLYEALGSARLVITRRLHVALPCIGLGTPVVCLPDPNISDARRRFSGFERALPIIFKDEKHRVGDIDWNAPPLGRIPVELEVHYAAFREHMGTPTSVAARSCPVRGVRVANPGLGHKPRPIFLRLGSHSNEYSVREWSNSEIELDLPNFAGLHALRISVETIGENGMPRHIGSLSELCLEPTA